ncbi:MAG: NAD(P)-dependent oxidoreductase [Betaproteobacteria bacterium]|nr:NAD(P)-dependent oxidoreductase [Betaproteobacteria bacterium]
MAEPVGLIGLGLLGRAIASRLQGAGLEVVGFDVDAAALGAFKGEAAGSLEEVGRRAKQIVLAVFDTADVESVTGRIRPEAFIDCTTNDPLRIEALASRLAAKGVRYIEATLSGSSEAVARGAVTMFVGGDPSGCEAILAAISSTRHHVGAVGMASRAKLATNLVLGLNRVALAEGMAFAEALGLPPRMFLDLIRVSPAASAAAVAKGERMLAQNFVPESRIRQHLKDVDLMLGYGKRAGLTLPLSTAHKALLAEAIEAGDGDLDNAAIIRRWKRSGT